MERVVVSLGGSVLVPDDGDVDYIVAVSSLLRRLASEFKMVVVCGGGRIARYYIANGRRLGGAEAELDWMGIEVTRLNARLLRIALGGAAHGALPRSAEEAVRACGERGIVVMGGTVPGHTTDAVAAMVAELWGADRIVNGTSVDAVYSADPKVDGSARRFRRLDHAEFLDLVRVASHDAGQTAVFDTKGAEIAKRTKIPVYIVNGRDLEELERAIRGRDVRGTVISSG